MIFKEPVTPKYSKKELKEWLYKNGFKALYFDWVKSGYEKDFKPSIDRKNSKKGYYFENIKLVTWYENRTNQYKEIRNAQGSSGERCKGVIQHSKDGEFIASYKSQHIAMNKTGISNKTISSCIRGITKTAGGFIWLSAI